MTEDIKVLEKGIIEKLPQIPFVVDQVGYAMDWAREAYDEGTYYKNIEFVLDVADYVTKISQPNFYKTHLVIAALLMDIPNAIQDAKFEKFKSASNSVENTLDAVVVKPELSEKEGCFKSISLQVTDLAKTNQEYLAIVLLSILSDLKEIVRGMKGTNVESPITAEDFIKVLGYSFVIQNLMFSKFNLLNDIREILSKIGIALNSIKF